MHFLVESRNRLLHVVEAPFSAFDVVVTLAARANSNLSQEWNRIIKRQLLGMSVLVRLVLFQVEDTLRLFGGSEGGVAHAVDLIKGPFRSDEGLDGLWSVVNRFCVDASLVSGSELLFVVLRGVEKLLKLGVNPIIVFRF